MTHHILKSYPSQFERMKNGSMKATVRFNDRAEGYKVGDTLTFEEGEPSLEAAEGFRGFLPGDTGTLRKGELDNTIEEGFAYTGETTDFIITDVDDFGCQSGYVTLSINADSVMVIHDDGLPECLKEQG